MPPPEPVRTLNDPPWGPTPLPPGARRVLRRLRDRGAYPIPENGPTALQARLRRLGYVREGPRPGWIEITLNGILALTPLE
jgi:hypothetical protein